MSETRLVSVGDTSFWIDSCTDRFYRDASGSVHGPFWELFCQGTWEPDIVARFRRSLIKEGVVVDIGAWIGPYSLWAAAAGRRTIAIEPDPSAAAGLLRNRSLLPDPQKLAVMSASFWSDGDTLLPLSFSELGDSETSIVSQKLRGGVQIKPNGSFISKAVTIDEISRFAGSKISMIKVDIEGAEYRCLSGIIDFVSKNRSDLILSFHPENNIHDCGIDRKSEGLFLSLMQHGIVGGHVEIKIDGEWRAAKALGLGELGPFTIDQLQAVYLCHEDT